MNCATHNTVAAVAYCRTCGKPLCAECSRDVRGTIFCEPCLAERLGTALPATPVTAPGTTGASSAAYTNERLPSPGLAAVLGFIPGVGAMYNGQFMKGFIHVMAFVCMIWMADRFGPIMIPVFFAYFFYLVFDAYKTAHAIELGQPLPDPFGIERAFPSSAHRPAPSASANPATPSGSVSSVIPTESLKPVRSVPTGAIVLIALGVLFMLHTVGLFEYNIGRFWSLILVFWGGWLLAKRWGALGPTGAACDCERCRMKCITWPVILITAGILILIDEFGVSIWRTWPAFLLVVGGLKLLQSNASDAGHIGGPPPTLPPLPPQAPPAPAADPNASIPSSGEVNHV
jgi:TM2 domain-containing membrane protein YozV